SGDPLFPLGRAWFDDRVGNSLDLRPRDVIRWADERWRQQQNDLADTDGATWLSLWPGRSPPPPPPPTPPLEVVIDQRVQEKMAEHKAMLKDKPHTLPPSADNLGGLVRTLLEQCLGRDIALLEIRKPVQAKSATKKLAWDLLV